MDLREHPPDFSQREGQASYVYQPRIKARNIIRSTYRDPFVPLLNGIEGAVSVHNRYQSFKRFWTTQESRIEALLDKFDSGILRALATFITCSSFDSYECRIPAGLIMLGSNISSLSRLLVRLQNSIGINSKVKIVTLNSKDASNIKIILRHIIRAIGAQEYYSITGKARKYVPYDLALIQSFCEREKIEKIVLAFCDSEAFNPTILADLIVLLSSCADRIPFILLFGIGTSIQLFEQKLPRGATALLQGHVFDQQNCNNLIDDIFMIVQTDQVESIWVGYNTSHVILNQAADHFQSPESFSNTVKYSYMSHFFASPLVSLVIRDTEILEPEYCELLRHVPSFQRYVHHLLSRGKTQAARELLDNNEILLKEAVNMIRAGQEKVMLMLRAVKWFHVLWNFTNLDKNLKISDVALEALSGNLLHSQLTSNLLSALEKLDFDNLNKLLDILPSEFFRISEFKMFFCIRNLFKDGNQPVLPHGFNNSHCDFSTTHSLDFLNTGVRKDPRKDMSINGREQLGTNQFYVAFHHFLGGSLIDFQDLVFHEAFILDLKTPLKHAFVPHPRERVEHALIAPLNYLGSTLDTFSSYPVLPATSILFQLYLDSGPFVNIHDMWKIFSIMVPSGRDQSSGGQEKMSLFYYSLAEFKLMGLAKHNKIDHIGKLAWAGL